MDPGKNNPIGLEYIEERLQRRLDLPSYAKYKLHYPSTGHRFLRKNHSNVLSNKLTVLPTQTTFERKSLSISNASHLNSSSKKIFQRINNKSLLKLDYFKKL